MTTCPRIYTVRVHPVSKMVRAMPTETQNEKAQPANPIIALQQETIVLTACMRSKDVREDVLPMLLEDDFVKSDHPIGREEPKWPDRRYRHAVRPNEYEILRGWT